MKYDVIIVGAGMGGLGAALHFSKCPHIKVLILEKEKNIGGTVIIGGVNCFEPGVASGSFHDLLASKLLEKNMGQVQKSVAGYPDKITRAGISKKDNEATYKDTLCRAGIDSKDWRRFVFEPDSMRRVIEELINKKNITVLTNHCVISAEKKGNIITGITAVCENEKKNFTADYFIDCSGDITLAQLSGCECIAGEESIDVYNERFAPKESSDKINGVTLVFRVSPDTDKDIIDYDSSVDVDEWFKKEIVEKQTCSVLNYYPNNDININMLPTMSGEEFWSMPSYEAKKICTARIKRYWDYFKKVSNIGLYEKNYHISEVFELIGIREGKRLVGRYVLTQNDMETHPSLHPFKDRFIAFADHAMDVHGANAGCKELKHPYGILYDCLLPKDTDNLLVACRGASFSHIAASSCRLSRTMLCLGEAAAKACEYAIKNNILLSDVGNINNEKITDIIM